tara:strand:- start:281 stop:1306 length:1026 start_codon:yes stop_codon:yes gene_type:complete
MASLTYSRAVTDPATDTDLGSQTDFQSNSWEVAKTPAKGEIKTATLTAGAGYSVPLNGTVLCSTTGSATGSGAVVQIKTAPSGILILRSPVNVTAGFMNFQNYLQLNLNIDDSQYTWARTTGSGDPMPDTAIGPVTTTAITGTGGSGTGATFLVSVNNGSVSEVTARTPFGGASGYKAGDIITLSVTNLQAAMNVANDNQPVIIQGDIELFLTEENISGKAIEIVSIINGGSSYATGDQLTLQEIGSTQVGLATMEVDSLGISSEVITAPNTGEYPRGIMTATPGLTGATAALTGTCEFKGIDGEQVIVSGFTTGKIIPISFKEITPAGTDLTLADVTIFY